MASIGRVSQLDYDGRILDDFYVVLNSCGYPIFEPTAFLLDIAKGSGRTHTSRAYAGDLAKFFNILERSVSVVEGHSPDFRGVTDRMMNAYLYGYLKQECNLSDSTVTRHIASLSRFYQFCSECGLMEAKTFSFSFTDSTISDTDTRLKELANLYIHLEDFERCILANVQQKNKFQLNRDEIALRLGYEAGFRTEELVINNNLSMDVLRKIIPEKHGDWVPKTIELTVKGKRGKTRKVLISVDMVNRLHRFMYHPTYRKKFKTHLICMSNGEPITNQQYGTKCFRLSKNAYLASAVIDEDARERWGARSFHVLRKCFATNAVTLCYKVGFDPEVFVPQWMGHSDPDLTRRVYIFFEAVMNDRLDLLKVLSLENTPFAKSYKQRYNIKNK